MNFLQRLKITFVVIIVLSILLLIYNFYSAYTFKNNNLSKDIMQKLHKKEKKLLNNIAKIYNINAKVPIIVSDKLGNRLYGMATLDKTMKIKIYLNKNMFQESEDYMINNVLAHEYAHALMFMFGNTSNRKKGHSAKWISICKNIGGVKCEQYVNKNDIVIDKRNIF